jgi:hypothetical protein
MKKIIYLISWLFCCINIYSQDIIDNLDMFLSKKYINSTNELYVYIEISINNRNINNLYVLKNYDIINIIEEEDGIILILSSWIDELDHLKYSSAMYHNPEMIEIRYKQMVYISLLLKVPENKINIDKNKKIKEIKGLKYSLNKYITEDITWANDVNEFASGIRNNVNEIVFIYNKYNHKYGNLWATAINPPNWILGTWVVDKYINDKNVSNNDRIIFEIDNILYFWLNLNEIYFSHGFNEMEQIILGNNYNIIFKSDEGMIFSINFKLEGEYLFSEHLTNNGIIKYRLMKR